MIRYLAALVTATLAGVAGVWLVLAPAALGYPGRRAYDSVASRVDLATGAGLCAVALVTGVVWAIAWRRRLRADGVLPRPRTPRTVRPAPPPEETQTQVIPVPAQLRTTTEPATATPTATPTAGPAPAATAPADAAAAPGAVAGPAGAAGAGDGSPFPEVYVAASGAGGAVPFGDPSRSGPSGAEEAPRTEGGGACVDAGGDVAVRDLRALLAPLVDALAEDVWRTRETAGVGGCAGRAGDDYAEETW